MLTEHWTSSSVPLFSVFALFYSVYNDTCVTVSELCIQFFREKECYNDLSWVMWFGTGSVAKFNWSRIVDCMCFVKLSKSIELPNVSQITIHEASPIHIVIVFNDPVSKLLLLQIIHVSFHKWQKIRGTIVLFYQFYSSPFLVVLFPSHRVHRGIE